jgi:hypothetical protein
MQTPPSLLVNHQLSNKHNTNDAIVYTSHNDPI